MRRLGTRVGFRQILPMLATASLLVAGTVCADENFVNELASPIDEPQVIIPENSGQVPVRPVAIEIQKSTDPLVRFVYETREATRRRLLSTKTHTPWQMMHGLLGLRQDFLIEHNGITVNGLEWIQTGPMYQNESWFQRTSFGGQAHPFNKPYWFEGHINQFLAILAMCDVPLDAQFGTPLGPITMRDMLKNAQMTVNEKEEVTWTLWALSTYLPPDAQWVNAKGERWSIERLVQLEVGKTVGGPTSPCGGTHGLYALARAKNVYLRTGKPLRGVWKLADDKINRYIQTAYLNRNPDGSLSSSFFKGREYKKDFDKRMASEGHVLEFLMMALPADRLKEPWVRRAIETTAKDLMDNRKQYVSCSPLYHATNAMTIYLNRVAPAAPQQVAQKPPGTQSVSSSKEIKTADAAAKPSTAVPAMPSTVGNSPSGSTLQVVPKSGPLTNSTAKPDPTKSANDANAGNVTPDGGRAADENAKSPAMAPSEKPPVAQPSGPLIPVPLPDPSAPLPATTPPPSPAQVEPVKEVPAIPATGTPESPKTESPKTEPPKTEPPKGETPNPESPKTEPAAGDAPAPAKPEATPPETTSESKTDSPTASESEPLEQPSLDLTIPIEPVESTPKKPESTNESVTRAPVSAEQPEIIAGTAEAVAPMINPVPLTIPVSPESTDGTAGPSTVLQPLLPIPTTRSMIAASPVSTSTVLPVEASATAKTVVKPSPNGANGTASTGSELPPLKDDPKSPPAKPTEGWKATPPGRRRPIVIDAAGII